MAISHFLSSVRITKTCGGKLGGEKAEFKLGSVTGQYPDSLSIQSTDEIQLSSEWQQYAIDLSGADLSHVIGGFCWVTDADLNPTGCTKYLDEVFYE